MDACFEAAVFKYSSRSAIKWLGDSIWPSLVTYKELGLWSNYATINLEKLLPRDLFLDEEIGRPVVAVAIDEVFFSVLTTFRRFIF